MTCVVMDLEYAVADAKQSDNMQDSSLIKINNGDGGSDTSGETFLRSLWADEHSERIPPRQLIVKEEDHINSYFDGLRTKSEDNTSVLDKENLCAVLQNTSLSTQNRASLAGSSRAARRHVVNAKVQRKRVQARMSDSSVDKRKARTLDETDSVITAKAAKKQRRLLRNRMSAQLHRERKKAYVDELEAQLLIKEANIAQLMDELLQVKQGFCLPSKEMCTGGDEYSPMMISSFNLVKDNYIANNTDPMIVSNDNVHIDAKAFKKNDDPMAISNADTDGAENMTNEVSAVVSAKDPNSHMNVVKNNQEPSISACVNMAYFGNNITSTIGQNGKFTVHQLSNIRSIGKFPSFCEMSASIRELSSLDGSVWKTGIAKDVSLRSGSVIGRNPMTQGASLRGIQCEEEYFRNLRDPGSRFLHQVDPASSDTTSLDVNDQFHNSPVDRSNLRVERNNDVTLSFLLSIDNLREFISNNPNANASEFIEITCNLRCE